MVETIKVYVETWKQTLAAPHAFPEKTELIERREFTLDKESCSADFWRPTGYERNPSFPRIEFQLKKLGAMPRLPYGQGYWFGVIGENK